MIVSNCFLQYRTSLVLQEAARENHIAVAKQRDSYQRMCETLREAVSEESGQMDAKEENLTKAVSQFQNAETENKRLEALIEKMQLLHGKAADEQKQIVQQKELLEKHLAEALQSKKQAEAEVRAVEDQFGKRLQTVEDQAQVKQVCRLCSEDVAVGGQCNELPVVG